MRTTILIRLRDGRCGTLEVAENGAAWILLTSGQVIPYVPSQVRSATNLDLMGADLSSPPRKTR